MLTRLPTPARVSAAEASRLLEQSFPETRFIDAKASAKLLRRFSELGIVGGAVYDGLVAATAGAYGSLLVSCDRRAMSTYQAVGVRFEILTAGSA